MDSSNLGIYYDPVSNYSDYTDNYSVDVDTERPLEKRALQLKYWPNVTNEKILVLEADSYVVIQAVNVSRNVESAVFQAHSQIHPVVMSHSHLLGSSNHVNGTSVGLLLKVSSDPSKNQVFLMNPQPFNVTVLAFIIFYDKSGNAPFF